MESIKYFGALHWFVIHTKPKDEQRVKHHLEGMEIEALLPLFEDFGHSHGKVFRAIHPLFPSYLFARLDLGLHYYKVKWTRGVKRILGVGNDPTPISGLVIQTLRERMRDDDTVELLEDLREGNLVQVTSGPLKDFVGVFQKGLASNKRVRILLTLIGVEIPVQVPRWQIKRVV